MRRLWAIMAAGWLVQVPAAVNAESTARGGLRGLLHTLSADTAGHGVVEGGVFSQFYTRDDADNNQHYFFVEHLQIGWGASPFAELGVEVPVRAWVVARAARTSAPSNHGGFGDLVASGKLRVPLSARHLKLGAFGRLSLPTGSRERGFSSASTDVELGGAATLDLSNLESFVPTRFHVNASWRWNRNETDGVGLAPLDNIEAGGFWPPAYPPLAPGGKDSDNDQLRLGAALEFSTRILALYTEFWLDLLPAATELRFGDNAVFVSQGALLKFRNGLNIKGAVDFSLQNDAPDPRQPTLPDWRLWLGVNWRLSLALADRDHDGIPNKKDKCPDQSEDFDGFEDEDGCPDIDNDADGVLDRDDLAPDLPEDKDGFEDDDGRPDIDNDGDGIRDEEDGCPNEPEDFDGDRDADGCPDLQRDADGDGIPDENDACPHEAEDMDGVEDDDGCPEADDQGS